MSTYAISDLHGDYNLYLKTLSEIKFDVKKDKLYILGDVIDRNKGAIKILLNIIDNQKSINMILGNHEQLFLRKIEAYDYVMFNQDIKEIVKKLLMYRVGVFSKISYDLSRSMFDLKKKEKTFELKKYKKWFEVSDKRKKYLDILKDFLKHIDYNEEKYYKVDSILSSIYEPYRTKPFLEELLEIDVKDYEKIKEYLLSIQEETSIKIFEKQFYLTHSLCDNNIRYYEESFMLPTNKEKNNSIFLFGHIPFIVTIRSLQKYGIDLYKKLKPNIFAYTDGNNKYFNLDTSGQRGVGVLKLDTLETHFITEKKDDIIYLKTNKVNDIYSISGVFESEYFKYINTKISKNAKYYILYKNDILYKIICLDKKTQSSYLCNFVEIKYHKIEQMQYYDNIENLIKNL